LESLVYESMVEKLGEFNSLSSQKTVSQNPKLTAAKIELAQMESEIEKKVESLLWIFSPQLPLAKSLPETEYPERDRTFRPV